MNETTLFDEILRRAKTDEWCRQCQEEVEHYESAFDAIRSQLSEEQQEVLDLYIAACENLEHAYSFIAYEIGKEKGVVRIYCRGEQYPFTSEAPVILKKYSEEKPCSKGPLV